MKRHIHALIVAVLIAAASAVSVSATDTFTIDDILGGRQTATAHELLTSSINVSAKPEWGYTTSFTKIDDTHVRLDNFFNEGLEVVFVLTDDDGNETERGTCLRYRYGDADVSKPHIRPGTWTDLGGYSYKKDTYIYAWVNPECVLNIHRTDDGVIWMRSTDAWWYRENVNSTLNELNMAIEIEYFMYEPNCSATHIRTDCNPVEYHPDIYDQIVYGYPNNFWIERINKSTDTKGEHFDAALELDYNTNRFTIKNFANLGLNTAFVTGDDLHATDPTTGADYDGVSNLGPRCFVTGSFDPETGKATFDPGQYALEIWNYKYMLGPVFKLPYRLMAVTDTDIPYMLNYASTSNLDCFSEELTGTITFTGENGVDHNAVDDPWVTHGGQRRTHEAGVTFTVDQPFSFVYTDNIIYTNDTNSCFPDANNRLGNGVIDGHLNWHDIFTGATFTGGADVTLETLYHRHNQVHEEGQPHTQLYKSDDAWEIIPVVHTVKNEKYVSDYELVAVPGTYTTAAAMRAAIDEGKAVDFTDAVTGEKGAHFQAASAQARAIADGIYEPGLYSLPRTKGATRETYTLAIKANYSNHLTPTYHDLYTVEFDDNKLTSIGVTPVDNAARLQASANAGAITVSGDGLISVCNTAGAVVATVNGQAEILAAPGIYLVTDGRTTLKVAVR